MQMTPDEYADYIADASRYQRGQHRWQAVRDRAKRVIDEIVAENAQMRGALEFYASPSTWQVNGHPQIDADAKPIVHDGGDRAREALKGGVK
ncbi:hypothetical protein [Thalassospira xiamenensis]|uniref:hypothetical protein n=1 Tax=Thalassospira xiamenensis TaxID=220697 RepID=UPI003AA82B23